MAYQLGIPRHMDWSFEEVVQAQLTVTGISNQPDLPSYVPGPSPPKLKEQDKLLDAVTQEFACSNCAKSFSKLHTLRRHELSHSANPRPYACEHCDLRFTQRSSLASHKSRFHEGTSVDYNCHLCPKKFTKKHTLKLHLGYHAAVEKAVGCVRVLTEPHLECSVCKKTFAKKYMKSHMLLHARSTSSSNAVDQNDFQCSFCPRQFRKSYLMTEHNKVHYSLQKNPEPNQDASAVECSHCKLKFPGPLTMKLHECQNEFLHQCPYCTRKFGSRHGIKRHIMMHLNQGEYKSKYCERRFQAKADSALHEKGHAEKGVCYHSDRFVGKQCKLCPEKPLTSALFQKHFMDNHYRVCSISVRRLEVNPISCVAETSSYVLCNTCGNCYTKSNFRLHCVLSKKCKCTDNEVAEMNEGEGIEDFIDDHSINKDQEIPHRTDITNSFPAIMPVKAVISETSDDHSDIDEVPDLFDGYNSPDTDEDKDFMSNIFMPEPDVILTTPEEDVNLPDDVKPDIKDLNLEHLQVCRLCDTILPKSFLVKHFMENHNEQVSVSVNRMLFKQLKLGYRCLVMVKPSSDTFNIPWYLCCKCSRTYTMKRHAANHTIYDCPLKDYYVPIPLTSRPPASMDPENKEAADLGEECTDSNCIENWKETWNDCYIRRENWAYVQQEKNNCFRHTKRTEDGKFKCNICGVANNSKALAKRHNILLHKNRFICDICGAQLSTKQTYEGHLRRHNGEKPFKCRMCVKAFSCNVSRHQHERDTHKKRGKGQDGEKYNCGECDRVFKSYMLLNFHVTRHHPKTGISNRNSDQFIVFCDQCHVGFFSRKDLLQHMRIVHQVEVNATKVKGKYNCDECPKVLLNKSSLNRHKLMFHPADGVMHKKYFGCSMCNKEYSLKASIKSHLRKQHTDALPVELLIEDTVTAEDGSVTFSIERFLVRNKVGQMNI